MSYGRRFLAIENKSYDLVCVGKNLDSPRISENGAGFKRSIFLNKEEFEWLLESLEDFC